MAQERETSTKSYILSSFFRVRTIKWQVLLDKRDRFPLFLRLFSECHMDPQPKISFDNTENAFAYRTDKQLKKAHFLFASMGKEWLVRLGTRFTPWAIKSGLPIKGIIRKTIFEQFVGGETLDETTKVGKHLASYGVQSILDYGVEGESSEEAFDQATEEFISVINYASTQPSVPFMAVKITGLARFGLLEKLDDSVSGNAGTLMKRYVKAVEALTAEEKAEWQRVHERIQRICRTASEKNVGVFIDAEETWIQDPVDVLTTLMMEQYNQQKVIVFNTYQLYRHDRLQFLKDSYEAASQRNFILGAKLVRGAYMEKERRRAAQLNYPSPIQPDKAATDSDYNLAVKFCVERLDNIYMVVASHNEYSNLYATELLREKKLPLNHPRVHFSQLYGMSDNITFNLAKAGCSVSKYLPFGPIGDVVPYLMRRAQENSSMSGQTGRELGLIRKEMKRRGL